MADIREIFGVKTFNDEKMRGLLSEKTYGQLKKIRGGLAKWDDSVADEVAAAMGKWAVGEGATHYTHWFCPMTGMNAGKHEAFLSAVASDGGAITGFSGDMLIKSEPDASSFPSGGLRSTFEARGYTAWDPTSNAFVFGTTLYIPTAFCSYNGEALDQKTPLLRSMQAVSKAAMRLLSLLGGTEVRSVNPTVGTEQEYFLIDRDYYTKRLDLMVCGRTLLGAKPPKGQELEDHYYGRIRTRVMAFMEDLDKTLWELGIASKTRHNEVAPAQHELALLYSTVNVATDDNQLVMQVMRTVARRHNFACLLHEKPFAGVNGSGKHDNWSLATDSGENLLSPSRSPETNLRFLLFLSAVIRALNRHYDLVRLSCASASNDCRLGGSEAPPAVISMFLGERLTSILSEIAVGRDHSPTERTKLLMGVKTLPLLDIDDCDRNRTSPFAFTGNKFELRMPGSSQSVGFPNTVLNTIVAESLNYMADELSTAENIHEAAYALVGRIFTENSRIIFNGNNYGDEWRAEAERRGLAEYKTTADVAGCYIKPENIELFSSLSVLSESECRSRYEILLENYVKLISIEAETMSEMVNRQVLPAAAEHAARLAGDAARFEAIGAQCAYARTAAVQLAALCDNISDSLAEMNRLYDRVASDTSIEENAELCRDIMTTHMPRVRAFCDSAEKLVPSKSWPLPTYSEMLYKQ